MSGRYFYAELRALRDFPEDFRDPELMVRKMSVITNVWTITEWWMYDEPRGIDFSQNKITSQNDPIRSLGLARLRSPINPEEWMIAVSQQYPADGRAAILHSFFVDSMAGPDGMWMIQQILKEPYTRALEPIVSTRPEDWCGVGGLGAAYSQQSICDLQGSDGLPLSREVLPRDLQQMMAKYDTETQPGGFPMDLYPVTAEMLFRLQELPLAQYSSGGDLPMR